MNDCARLMRHAVHFGIITLLVLASGFGCGPTKITVTPETGLPAVTHPDILPVALDVAAGSGTMTVRWRQQGTGVISGYNVFIAREPLGSGSQQPNSGAAVAPHNTTVYPGDTDLDDGVIEYVADGLADGVKYYVSVRVVFPDQSMSRPSNEVVAVCGPRGELSLSLRYKSDADGYSLVTGRQVRADGSNNDLYFFSKDGVEYLASPNRLNSYLRKSTFTIVSNNGTFEEIRRKLAANEADSERWVDKAAVKPGSWLLVRTAENYAALIHVTGSTGEGDARSVTLWYALCPLSGEMIF